MIEIQNEMLMLIKTTIDCERQLLFLDQVCIKYFISPQCFWLFFIFLESSRNSTTNWCHETRIEESLDALTGFLPWTWPQGTTRSRSQRKIVPRLHSALHLGCLSGTTCPLGFVSPPRTFQKLMQWIFSDQQCQCFLLYLDVIFSPTEFGGGAWSALTGKS